MGPRFDRLPPAVRRLHSGAGSAVGAAEVVRGRHPLARMVAALFGFPPAGSHRLLVTFATDANGERWTRAFGRHRFSSRLDKRGTALVERFGPLRFAFDLVSEDAGLRMAMTGWSCAGVPMPMRLAPRTLAREWQQDGRFHFAVALALPLIGDVVAYSGWLRPD
ncbi:DUF4166 domain-containing protein [Sandarakinorhabdus sp. DWP1-3-1]|uniref:DUF4166 domain-containing protein n=1 Tax=Sandarakinorhabdus sp. DWP1-3-1 TaxID=2804627 RepID=UPI003CF08A33